MARKKNNRKNGNTAIRKTNSNVAKKENSESVVNVEKDETQNKIESDSADLPEIEKAEDVDLPQTETAEENLTDNETDFDDGVDPAFGQNSEMQFDNENIESEKDDVENEKPDEKENNDNEDEEDIDKTARGKSIIEWKGKAFAHKCPNPKCNKEYMLDRSTKACTVLSSRSEVVENCIKYRDREMKCSWCNENFIAREKI